MERPIIFSTPMVQAILEGRKTQTRRVVKPCPCGYEPVLNKKGLWEFSCESHFENDDPEIHIFKCPYGKIGDLLYVRETWMDDSGTVDHRQRIYPFYRYKANGEVYNVDGTLKKWKPSIFMPKYIARIWLEIVDISIERIWEITDGDIAKEGCEWSSMQIGNYYGSPARDVFVRLWDSINKKRGYGWDDEPWVWVITFKRVNHHDGLDEV